MSKRNHQNAHYLLLGLFFLSFLPETSSAQSLKYSKNLFQNKDWSFVENKGQVVDNQIKFYGRQGGVHLYCKPGMIEFVFTKLEKGQDSVSEATGQPIETQSKSLPHMRQQSSSLSVLRSSISTSRADLILLNSNPHAQILASDQQEYYENYYTTGNADSGITNVHTFKTLTYKEIYPHIDMVLACREKGLEYSFVVYPGGKVSDIQMQWEGIEKNRKINDNGIEYSTTLGKIDEGKPVSFQGENSFKSDFLRRGNRVGFKVGGYDKNKVLVIDPTLEWASYYGGNSEDGASGVSIDSLGNVYITGTTESSSGIATSGEYQTSYDGGYSDAFLAKFTSSGALSWSTYYGGNDQDVASGVTTDGSHNVYITGYSLSSNGIATFGAYQTSYGGLGCYDAFLAKFSSLGILYWGTYYGGSGCDYGASVCTDITGNIYISGCTSSSSGIATSGAYQTSNVGSNDAFLAKFSSSGALSWGTYYGGSSGTGQWGFGVSADVSGNIYITGCTESISGIATSGAYQTSYGGGVDAFLAKFSSSGSLSWGTYYGGNCRENGESIITDASGNVYITGITCSTSGIATSGAYKSFYTAASNTSYSGAIFDVFLAKFNSSGALSWGTYYGGNEADEAAGISIDGLGNVYITGYTSSSSGIATSGAYLTSNVGIGDAFLAKFSSAGAFSYGTYFGGDSGCSAEGVSADVLGNVYIIGVTGSDSGIATSGAYQKSNAGENDAFVAKFHLVSQNDAGIASIQNPKGILCSGNNPIKVNLKNFGSKELDSVKINVSINGKLQYQYNWKGKIPSDSEASVTIFLYSFPPGLDIIKAWTSLPNGFKDSVPENDTAITIDTVYTIPIAVTTQDTNICPGTHIALGTSAISGHTYSWTSNPPGFTSTLGNPIVSPKDSVTEFYLTETNIITGCSATDSTKISITKVPPVNAGGNHSICFGDSVTLGSLPMDTNIVYVWYYEYPQYPYPLFVAQKQFITVYPLLSTVYYLKAAYRGSYTPNTCFSEDSTVITVLPYPVPNAGPNRSICIGSGTTLGSFGEKGITYKWGSVPSGFSAITPDPFVYPKTNTTYFLTETNSAGCAATDSVTITLNPLPKPNPGQSKILCSGDTVTIGANNPTGYLYSWHSLQSSTYPLQSRITIIPVIPSWYVLTATDSATGCIGKDSVYVYTNPLPQPKISGSTEVCTQVSNTYTTPLDSGSTYLWTLKSGQILSGSHADSVHLEPDTGFNTVMVKETDINGCKNTDSLVIYASQTPNAHWKLLSDSPLYIFKAIDSTEQYYQWLLGDGGTGSTYLISHKYDFMKDSSLDVSLTVGSAFGCSATFDSTIRFQYSPPLKTNIDVYPTLFSQTTNIKISLGQSSHIRIVAYDEIGRLIGKLADMEQPVGTANYEFDAARYSLAYGVYYIEILVDGKVYVKPVVRVE